MAPSVANGDRATNPGPQTFRVFISSTFSDLKAERDALQRRVFPRLRTLCAAHGARFQAIDLRWGISEQASLDHQTMPVCLREIARCQRAAPRPNFILLLGDRYGWRPLPAEIPADEFDAIAGTGGLEDEADLLARWYRPDDNAVPPVYFLRPRSGRYEDYDVWEAEVERPLRQALGRAAEMLELGQDARLKYVASATEREIVHGALRVPDAGEHVFGFFRRIEGLPQDERARDYVDLDGTKAVDDAAQRRLRRLKARLADHLAGNIHRYTAHWSGEGITSEHLQALCDDVYQALSSVILAELARQRKEDPLDRENAAHESFGEERRRSFTGRADALRAISDYLRGGATHPLAIVGEAGSGKSALLAQAAARGRAAHPQAEVLVRFIGATPSSTDGRLLLTGLCRQIDRLYGEEGTTLPDDYLGLCEAFSHRLGRSTADRPLYLFLDAVDQLSAADNARALVWLPAALPEHVRLVVSTVRGPQESLLRRKLPQGHVHVLARMGRDEAGRLLDRWLDQAGRRLQPAQRDELMTKSAASGLPLYLKLAFEQARGWTSHQAPPDLAPDIAGLLDGLFERLASEAWHGLALVDSTLGYLAAARNGLTEDELLDLLSADEAVMDDFRRRSPRSPAVGRLPVAVWSRLHGDLEPYLVEQQADGTTTLTFYHPTTFGQAVRTAFLSGDRERRRHRVLAGYFAAKPLVERAPDGTGQPERRKLAEQPYQQARGEMWSDLEETLTDLDFLQAKVSATGPRSLIGDYDEAFRVGYQGPDLLPLREALRLSEHVTAADAGQLPGQLAGRIADIESPASRELLEQLETWREVPWLRPLRPSLMPAGGPLRHTLEGHDARIESLAVTPDGRLAVTGGGDATLTVWDLQRREVLTRLSGHTDAVRDVVLTDDGQLAISASADETIRVWDVPRATGLRTLRGHEHAVNGVALTPDGRHVVSASADETLRVWDVQSGTLLCTLTGHTDWVRAVAVTPDGARAVSGGDDQTVRVWDLEAGSLLRTLSGHRHRVYDLVIVPDGRRAISASADRHLIVWDLESGRALNTLRGHGDRVHTVALTADGQRLISGSADRTVKVWGLNRGLLLRTLHGHTRTVSGLAATADGRRILSVSVDGTLRIWDPERSEEATAYLGHPGWGVRSLAVTPDGRRLISASGDNTLRVWDLQQGTELAVLSGHGGGVEAVAVTPDGRRAVSGSQDRTIKVWDLERFRVIHTLRGHTGRVNAIAVTPDGRRAVSASHDQSLSIWDLDTGSEIRPLVGHSDDVTAVAVAPDGKQALSAAWSGELVLWDLSDGRQVTRFRGLTSGVRTLALRRNGKEAVIGGQDGVLRRIDLAGRRLLDALDGHEGVVWKVTLAPDGRHLFSASGDQTIKAWDLSQGRALATFTGESPMISCAVGPDGVTVIAGESQSRIHFLRLVGPT
jgi:WD40 repeat protein